MKKLNWYAIGVVVFIPLLIMIINFLFFRGNNVTLELVDKYIAESETISLTVPPWQSNMPPSEQGYERTSKVYYPKLKRIGDGTRVIKKFIFFDDQYQKYFAIISIEFTRHYSGSNSARFSLLDRNATFSALVHPLLLNNTDYGSRENPIPVFSKELLAQEGRYQIGDEMQRLFYVKENERRAYIEEYLKYFTDKKEFNEMFEENTLNR